jgi:hypothetical protein
LHVIGSVGVGSEDGIEFFDDSSDGEVGVVVVALDEPVDGPARSGVGGGEGDPGQALGRVHGEVEAVVRSSSGGTSVVTHEQVGGGNAESLLSVGQVGELALIARVTRGLSERVLDALFDGRVADGSGGVSGVVGQALVASQNGGRLVLGDTSGNDTSVVGEIVGELTGEASERGGSGKNGVVSGAVSDGREALLTVSGEAVGGDALSTGLEGRIVSAAEGNILLVVANSSDSDSVGLEGQTVTAVIVGSATAGNIDTGSRELTEGLDISAQASAGGAVVEDGAGRGNVIASVGLSAPSGSSVKGRASSAVVVGSTASGNGDAGLLGLAPRETSGADALTGLAVVVGRNGAVGGDVVASVGQSTPSSSNLEISADSAAVVVVAARRNDNARLGVQTPGLASGANALTGLTVVVSGSRAVSRDVVASVGQRAPGSSGPESIANAAVVVSSATSGNSNAGSLSSAPREVSFAKTLAGLAVVAGWTDRGNVVASVGSSTPSGSRQEGSAGSASVVSVAARGDVDARS